MAVELRSGSDSGWAISSPLHNKLAEEDRPVHAWYRFVLSFPPHLVRKYLADFSISTGSTVLDPFCGTGTTLVECKKHGIVGIGLEANPMAAFASDVKTNWAVQPGALLNAASRIEERAEREFGRQGIGAHPQEFAVAMDRRNLIGQLALDDEAEKIILANSISPIPLHRVLTIKQLIAEERPRVQPYLRLALAWTIVNTAGNVRFGPEVGITPAKSDADVLGSWVEQVQRMAEDLRAVKELRETRSDIYQVDSRSNTEVLHKSIDAVITSPPYPNEKDYTRTTRLESVILDLIRTRKDLRSLKQHLLRSNTRNVFVSDDDDAHVVDNKEVNRIAKAIEKKRIELGKDSGFERLYHRVTKLYFGGMKKHLIAIQPLLKPGARLAYVVGDQASYLQVMIKTGCLLAEIAEQEGYRVENIELFRTRMATATRQQLREEVVVLSWPGKK